MKISMLEITRLRTAHITFPMGLLFVIAFHLVVLFILGSAVSIIAGTITLVVARERRNRKVLTGVLLPHTFLFTFYLVFLVGNTLISIEKDVDLGIGDAWYVPIGDSFQLLMIDLTDQGSVYTNNGHEPVISDVTHAKLKEDTLVVKTMSHQNEAQYLLLSTGVIGSVGLSEIELNGLPTVHEFYRNQWWKVTGWLLYGVGISGLVLASLISYLFGRLILHDWSFFKS